MYAFRELSDDDAQLDGAPLMRALDFLRDQFLKNPNGIPLTKSKAFRRTLVADAITTIQWPDWTEQRIYHGYMPIKVADEYHFEPFWILHHILLEMKLFRNYRGRLQLSKAGAALFACRFKTFDTVAQEILLRTPYFANLRMSRSIIGTWDIWLNVLDTLAQYGVSGKCLTEALYGPLEGDGAFDPRTDTLYSGVLTPLIWAGLLSEHKEFGRKLTERVYMVTPLWPRYLELDPKRPALRVVH